MGPMNVAAPSSAEDDAPRTLPMARPAAAGADQFSRPGDARVAGGTL